MMEARTSRHVCAMIHRALAGFALAGYLVACGTETTSIGGPLGNQSSPSSKNDDSHPSDDDSGSSSGGWTPPASSSADGGGPDAFPCGYSWMPAPSTGLCEYLLPTERQNNSPDLDPETWDPRNVRVDLSRTTPPNDAGVTTTLAQAMGGYKETAATCGTDHGWYYVSPDDGGRPTSYALCPTSCDFLNYDHVIFRLLAFGWCGPR
jgi:hypothetical protein